MYLVDQTDDKILELLKDNARISYSDIADEVHMTRAAVRGRIRNMEKHGIILGYTVLINSHAYNKYASIFLEIEVAPQMIDKVAVSIAQLEDVAIISQHTGKSGLHVHLYLDKMEKLPEYLEKNIYLIEGVRDVHSYVLMKSYKTTSYLTIP